MTLTLSNNDICDLRLACSSIIIDAKRELADENTTADRKAILEGTIEKWQNLKNRIIEQQAAQSKSL